ncbi:MAG: sulfite oxidase [Thermomicrobiales bacterium]|nr:sulfite oxidase [Thermomicrobiales bacterium]
MVAPAEPNTMRYDRRTLIKRLAAAGFAAPVIASIVADGAWAQDAATAVSGTPVPTPASTAAPAAAAAGGTAVGMPEIASPFTIIPPNTDAAAALESIGVKSALIPHGGFNFGTPPELVTGFDVDNDAFYIRSHGPSAQLDDLSKYNLSVNGHVDTPLDLTLDDLKGMPSRTYQSFLECSGNGRGFFNPVANGGQWRNDAIGNAEWTGVPLHVVLDKAGVKDGAVDVVSQGGDFPEMQRGLPIDVAMGVDTMLVLQMNGQDLPAPHGGPVRLFVPGWGGIASTKWLIGLTVMDSAFQGSFNVGNYIVVDAQGDLIRPVREMPVSSAIWTPAFDAPVKAGNVPITGFAWSGLGGLAKVEVSTDNGVTWNEAKITDAKGEHSWARFEYQWDAKPGPTGLLTRATDDRGTAQPGQVPWNKLGYQYNAVQRVMINVSA